MRYGYGYMAEPSEYIGLTMARLYDERVENIGELYDHLNTVADPDEFEEFLVRLVEDVISEAEWAIEDKCSEDYDRGTEDGWDEGAAGARNTIMSTIKDMYTRAYITGLPTPTKQDILDAIENLTL